MKSISPPDDELRIAIIGRPNVGKSSLTNRILGYERSLVSELAGTTRDTVDTVFKRGSQTYRLIDTAGIRRKGKTFEGAENFLSSKLDKPWLERMSPCF